MVLESKRFRYSQQRNRLHRENLSLITRSSIYFPRFVSLTIYVIFIFHIVAILLQYTDKKNLYSYLQFEEK